MYHSGLKTKKKNFNFSGVSYLSQKGYQTHGRLYWETMQTYLFYLKYFTARQLIYLASFLYSTHALWKDRWAMQFCWDVSSHSQINITIITWALTSTSFPLPLSFMNCLIFYVNDVVFIMAKIRVVGCAVTALHCGFECYKLLCFFYCQQDLNEGHGQRGAK